MLHLMHIQNLKSSPLKPAGRGKQGGFGNDEVLCYTTYNPLAMWEMILKTSSRHCNLAVIGFRRGRTLEGASGWRLTTTSVVQSQH